MFNLSVVLQVCSLGYATVQLTNIFSIETVTPKMILKPWIKGTYLGISYIDLQTFGRLGPYLVLKWLYDYLLIQKIQTRMGE